MADFGTALRKVLKWEGVYDFDPDDKGGETCFGITRVFESGWPGWAVVDDLKRANIPKNVWGSDVSLKGHVESYYRSLWNSYGLDDYSDELAQCIFGGVVNQGAPRVVRWLQGCLLALGASVTVDGDYGPSTKAAMAVLGDERGKLLLAGLKAKRVAAYFDTAAARENNRKYLGGWLNRLNDGA